jgi:hypothetical protein
MFEIHCEELIRALVKRADLICGKLIAKMFRNHQEINTRYLCDTDYVSVWGEGMLSILTITYLK